VVINSKVSEQYKTSVDSAVLIGKKIYLSVSPQFDTEMNSLMSAKMWSTMNICSELFFTESLQPVL